MVELWWWCFVFCSKIIYLLYLFQRRIQKSDWGRQIPDKHLNYWRNLTFSHFFFFSPFFFHFIPFPTFFLLFLFPFWQAGWGHLSLEIGGGGICPLPLPLNRPLAIKYFFQFVMYMNYLKNWISGPGGTCFITPFLMFFSSINKLYFA